jgi:ATP-dependent DNA ligase
LNKKFHYIATALKDLLEDTVIDGELVAFGPDGRPDFNLLQRISSAESRIVYHAFDILIHEERNLVGLPRSERRAILSSVIELGEHVALSQVSERSANWSVEQVPGQPGPGVRSWWVRSQPPWR